MFGPVQTLRLYGSMCPYFEGDEDRAVRAADLILKAIPIRWYRKLRVAPTQANDGETLMSATRDMITGRKRTELAADEDTIATMTQYVGIDASLDLIDTPNGPALFIESNDCSFVDDDDDESQHSRASVHKTSKTILLRNIRKASRGKEKAWKAIGLENTYDTGIFLYRRQKKDKEGSKKKILTLFEVMPSSSITRNETLKHLKTIISWDKVPGEDDKSSKKEKSYNAILSQKCDDMLDIQASTSSGSNDSYQGSCFI